MNQSNFVFTRYLYEKEEVKLSLLFAILKRKEEAAFWAYELYYSGFKDELKDLFWSIYYDFFATLNPAFNIYLLKQLKEPIKDDKIVAQLVENFKIRPFNLDVFMLRHQVKLFEVEKNQGFDIENGNYSGLANCILEEANLVKYLEGAIEHFEKKGLKINKKKMVGDFNKIIKVVKSCCKNVILLAQILHLYSLEQNIKMGKNLYVVVESEEIVMYETILANSKIRTHKVLELGRLYEIDSDNYLSLFQLKREKVNIKNAFLDNWLYYTLETPFWSEKIARNNGTINNEERLVCFNEETDDFDNFWDSYNYEPDEQKKIVQDRSIRELQSVRTWNTFYKEYSNKGIVHIEDEFLDEFEIHL